MRKCFVVEFDDNDPARDSFERLSTAIQDLNRGSMIVYQIEPGKVVPVIQDDVANVASKINRKELQDRARLIIANARKALGHDLNGSLTDLLLDNIHELRSVADARKLILEIGEVAR